MKWYRIDRGTAEVSVVSRERVDELAASAYSDCDPDTELDGRFSTPWAIVVREDRISDSDRVAFTFPK